MSLLNSYLLAGFWVVCFFSHFSEYPSSLLYFSFFSYFAISVVWGRNFGVLGFLWTQVWLLWPMQEELHIWCFSALLLSLRRIQIKFSEGMKGFLANCRDVLPLFCLGVYKQNIPGPWNVVFHKCLMKNTFYWRKSSTFLSEFTQASSIRVTCAWLCWDLLRGWGLSCWLSSSIGHVSSFLD